MNIYLSFDVEVWPDVWTDLDGNFERHFQRYVYGRSEEGDYALPKTLEILNRYGLCGVFFVETLFSGRFGAESLAEITDLIRAGNQDVQLHLHPEWTDEMRSPPISCEMGKRQNLTNYSFDEQKSLLAWSLDRMAEVGCTGIDAFRAGNYAANADTLRALQANNIHWDSSFNPTVSDSGADLRAQFSLENAFEFSGVQSIPVSVFRDGLGNLRQAQIGACSFEEMRSAIESAHALGREHFVIVSHNFEMLKPHRNEHDAIVVRRFDALCKWLSENRDRFSVGRYAGGDLMARTLPLPEVGIMDTAWRLGEQAWRRFT